MAKGKPDKYRPKRYTASVLLAIMLEPGLAASQLAARALVKGYKEQVYQSLALLVKNGLVSCAVVPNPGGWGSNVNKTVYSATFAGLYEQPAKRWPYRDRSKKAGAKT